MDITNFMTWFVSQVARIFTYTYTTLDSIQFGGTSILRVMIWIIILGALFKITLTIPQRFNNSISERRKEHKDDNKSK